MFGACEDDGAFHIIFREERCQHFTLVDFFGENHRLVDPVNRLGIWRNRDFNRAGQKVIRQTADLLGHCGRKQQRLALIWRTRHDLTDGRDKTKIQHLVSLVEDNCRRAIQTDNASGHMIKQATGRCDNNIDTAG